MMANSPGSLARFTFGAVHGDCVVQIGNLEEWID